MRLRNLISAIALAIGIAAIAVSSPASAACKKLGFTVNDYGKVGPTADAKRLLPGYVAKWAKARGVAKYKMGKVSVSCYKFLDFGFVDEWTCKAVSNVCFKGRVPPDPTEASIRQLKKKKAAAKARAEAKKKKRASRKKRSSKKKTAKNVAKSAKKNDG